MVMGASSTSPPLPARKETARCRMVRLFSHRLGANFINMPCARPIGLGCKSVSTSKAAGLRAARLSNPKTPPRNTSGPKRMLWAPPGSNCPCHNPGIARIFIGTLLSSPIVSRLGQTHPRRWRIGSRRHGRRRSSRLRPRMVRKASDASGACGVFETLARRARNYGTVFRRASICWRNGSRAAARTAPAWNLCCGGASNRVRDVAFL